MSVSLWVIISTPLSSIWQYQCGHIRPRIITSICSTVTLDKSLDLGDQFGSLLLRHRPRRSARRYVLAEKLVDLDRAAETRSSLAQYGHKFGVADLGDFTRSLKGELRRSRRNFPALRRCLTKAPHI